MGLYDEARPGRPRSIDDERIMELLYTTLHAEPPGEQDRWSVRTAAEEMELSKSTVQRVWSAFGVQPHRQKHFKLSTDPFFVEKVIDVTGLYLNPPEHAMVLCVDEKSQVQALERTQPLLPLGLGYVEGVTHNYIHNGTTTLFAALDVATGQVLAQCKPRHRHQEFLQFLKHIDESVPPDLDIHLVMDNYGTHKHAKVKRWLAARPRYHVHFTPTYASWLNQVEIWFNIITQKAIRRGSFRSVPELIAKIQRFTDHDNPKARPFMWTATAESILGKIERLCQRISGHNTRGASSRTPVLAHPRRVKDPRRERSSSPQTSPPTSTFRVEQRRRFRRPGTAPPTRSRSACPLASRGLAEQTLPLRPLRVERKEPGEDFVADLIRPAIAPGLLPAAGPFLVLSSS